ncbi:MlaE family ABC transporter permease [Geoalkalibacter halelectricus]|uniref:MlaE family lipid ABC transporter permease subunit n=1 Tax=Geoalkalibacter halelectricus TaxID=2847045 RepID=A0ABY5ZSQ6_9BACT|nr:MlaE family lipid ABC transporter permease subunit [Geoalkalibacter halelectricus]MDO3379175.1 MlaE family lipid ABC transporter permease subunit [Geoalkalibacter halelectricus]UWZ80935.1 MlaE family lipid ABC transporter permease subunit [Geoalkalibacter halelectricus]
MVDFFEKLGDRCLYLLEQLGRMGIFLFACLVCVFKPPYKINPVLRQIHFIGSRSIYVIFFTGAFTGMVLGLQGYYTLRKFGSEGLLGSAVALSLIRELGPVVAALMVIGRAGSAICAEIGIMRNSEQIDALECMAIDPYKYLMAPKFIAAIISLPLLTAIFDVVGILGGWLIGVVLLGINEGSYFQSMYASVEWQDIKMGLVKSLVFGLLLIWIATAKGYFLHLERGGGFGAEGVSRTTTDAVVLSSVAVLLWDYLISAIML